MSCFKDTIFLKELMNLLLGKETRKENIYMILLFGNFIEYPKTIVFYKSIFYYPEYQEHIANTILYENFWNFNVSHSV